MLLLNGNKFALNDKEFNDTLFQVGGTAVGYYRPLKSQIKLFNIQKKLIGTITENRVLAKATFQEDTQKYWYSYGTIKEVGEYDSYIKQVDDIEAALKLLKK